MDFKCGNVMEYCPAIKRNKLIIYGIVWVNLKKYDAKSEDYILYESIDVKF